MVHQWILQLVESKAAGLSKVFWQEETPILVFLNMAKVWTKWGPLGNTSNFNNLTESTENNRQHSGAPPVSVRYGNTLHN